MYGDYKTDLSFVVAQGTLLWQPAKFWKCSQTSCGMTFTLCFSIRQWIGYHKSAFERFNGNNQATSCPNLVNFRLIISELRCSNAQFLPQFAHTFDDDLRLSTLSKGLEDRNFDFSRVIGNQI